MYPTKYTWLKKYYKHILIVVVLIVIIAIIVLLTRKRDYSIDPTALYLNACQLNIVISIIALNENSQHHPVYEYCENINDGRGYTAGWLGLTTGTEDVCTILKKYMKEPNNLSKYKHVVCPSGSNVTSEVDAIGNYCDDWKGISRSDQFKHAQDQFAMDEYFLPAINLLVSLLNGKPFPLSVAFFLDTVIQHGISTETTDPFYSDSLNGIVDSIHSKTFEDEKNLIKAMMRKRYNVLDQAANPASRIVWRESKHRAQNFIEAAEDDNWQLKGDIDANGKIIRGCR
jgi:chitosanase